MGIDFFSLGQNNPTSFSSVMHGNSGWSQTGLNAYDNLENAFKAPANAANAAIGAANLATENEQAIYSKTANDLNPYIDSGFDSMNMMRQMMGMKPMAKSSSGAPNKDVPNSPGIGGSLFINPGSPPDPNAGHRASGGPTYPGQSYVVGERGPEIVHMAPGAHGYVEPNSPKADAAAYGHGGFPGRVLGGPINGGTSMGDMPMGGGLIKGIYDKHQGNASSTMPIGQTSHNENVAAAKAASPASTSLTPSQIMKMDPSYKFQLQQGEQAVQMANLAGGSGLSGRETKGAIGYAEGLASQDYSNIFNREATIAGMGESAAGTLGEVGMYTGMNEGNNYMYAGNAAAGGYQAPWNAAIGVGQNVSSLIGSYLGGGGKI